MQSFFEWFEERAGERSVPWLILGKGPSFARRRELDLSPYRLLSLNHAVREQRVEVAHVIDLDVLDACGEAIEAQAQVLVMPWIPHVESRPGASTLAELARRHPTLRRLDRAKRLLWYNAGTASRARPGSPVVPVTFFSAEAAVNLLAAAGVRTLRTLGVDGGRSYGDEFADLRDETLLCNGQPSFDRQFEKIAETLWRTGIDLAPLDLPAPARVFVGATEAQMLPTRVLEYSIRRRASLSVRVEPLHRVGIEIPLPRDPRQRPRTPFSFQRFLIPEAMGYRGRALYLDSDMQVFDDIRKLWTLPFRNAPLLAIGGDEPRRAQFAVMLLDCEALRWDVREIVAALDRGELDYDALMQRMSLCPRIDPGIHPRWNSLDSYRAGHTGLLHYTHMPTQPWLSADHPLGHLWVGALSEALECGFIAWDEVERAVRAGFVRPSLAPQLERGILDGRALPLDLRRRDHGFVPPHCGAVVRGAA